MQPAIDARSTRTYHTRSRLGSSSTYIIIPNTHNHNNHNNHLQQVLPSSHTVKGDSINKLAQNAYSVVVSFLQSAASSAQNSARTPTSEKTTAITPAQQQQQQSKPKISVQASAPVASGLSRRAALLQEELEELIRLHKPFSHTLTNNGILLSLSLSVSNAVRNN